MAYGREYLQTSGSIGYGSDSGHDSSITRSGINTANIHITDTEKQQQLSGKSAAETQAQVKTELTTDTYAQHAGYLQNNFDKDEVQAKLDLQLEVSQDFSRTLQSAGFEMSEKIDEYRKAAKAAEEQAKTARAEGNLLEAAEQRQIAEEAKASADNWQKGKLLLSMIGAGLAAPTDSASGILAATVSPAVAYKIGEHFKQKAIQNLLSGKTEKAELTADQKAAHILAHTLLGAAVAAAGGNDALSAGLAAGGAEAAAPVLARWLYGTDDPEQLTPDQKQTISSIAGLAGAATGAATGNMADAVAGSMGAQNAVESNALSNFKKDVNVAEKELSEACSSGGGFNFNETCQKTYNKWMAISSEKEGESPDPKKWASYAQRADELFAPAKAACEGDSFCLSQVSQLQLNAIVTSYGYESASNSILGRFSQGMLNSSTFTGVMPLDGQARQAYITVLTYMGNKAGLATEGLNDVRDIASHWGGRRSAGSGANSTSASARANKKPKKAESAAIGDTVPTPTTHPELFSKRRDGTYVSRSNEIFSKSHTNHSRSTDYEWKVGYGGADPRAGKKITLDQSGKVIKHDK